VFRRYSNVHQQVPYYERLTRLFDFFANWQILPFDREAADEFIHQKRIPRSEWIMPKSFALSL
jgi:hypothetical protein